MLVLVSASFVHYRAALTAPGALPPVLASALARLPIAMFGLATLLYVQRTTGSFATAGLVTAAALTGVSVGSVAQGRLMDRVGPTRPLLLLTALFAVAVGALIAAVETAQPLPVLLALSLLNGLAQPAMPAASRALWGVLLPPGPSRDAAYTYEAISLEVFFIIGPAFAVFLVLAPWPGTGLAVAAAAMIVGALGFALSRPVRAQRAGPAGASIGLLGALGRPAMRTVALASLGFGVVIGVVEVGVPAVTTAVGSPALGGVLISAWSVTSVLAGLLYSLRPWPRPLHLRMPALLAGFAVLVGAMALVGVTGSLVLLTVAMLAAGALITPQVTAHSIAVDGAAPAGTATEAFGWVITAATLGLAAGQSMAGIVIEAAGPPAAFLAGGIAGVGLAVVLWVRRSTLLVEDPSPAEVVELGAH
jgi:MFS family permease